MCLAKAYLDGDGETELLLEDVVLVEVHGARLRVSTLFGEEKLIEGVLKAVDFQNGSVVIEPPS